VTPEERALRGRLGAAVLHSRYHSADLTRAARLKFMERFINEVDPHRRLPEPERLRRAEQARRAHFLRLALASVKARRRGRGAKGG
jgi:hypothetical protein